MGRDLPRRGALVRVPSTVRPRHDRRVVRRKKMSHKVQVIGGLDEMLFDKLKKKGEKTIMSNSHHKRGMRGQLELEDISAETPMTRTPHWPPVGPSLSPLLLRSISISWIYKWSPLEMWSTNGSHCTGAVFHRPITTLGNATMWWDASLILLHRGPLAMSCHASLPHEPRRGSL